MARNGEKLRPAVVDQIVAAYRQHPNVSVVGEQFDVSPTTVSKYVKEAGIPVVRGGRTRYRRKNGPMTPLRRRIASNGYAVLYAYIPASGVENRHGRQFQVLEHRFVMERLLGRALLLNETVHHKNGVRDDNREENLELWTTKHPAGMSHCPHCDGKL